MAADPLHAWVERSDVGEDTALLPQKQRTQKKTPLPKLQLGVVMLTQVCAQYKWVRAIGVLIHM
jgi:hypothetical protein